METFWDPSMTKPEALETRFPQMLNLQVSQKATDFI